MKNYYLFNPTGVAMLLFSGIFVNVSFAGKQHARLETVQAFKVAEARQGVAVDSACFYTINSKGIGKYGKKDGKLIAEWEDHSGRIIHIDGGVVVDKKLYCAHSNFSKLPMTSSIEIFDTKNLEHIGSHSFGINYGSCTWADYHQGYWWVCFAHYDRFEPVLHKNNSWTVLVKFDENWREMESWTFPAEMLEEFKPMSCSGGSWGPDGNLYVTGHDSSFVYVVQLPKMGSVLELTDTLETSFPGQGIAWDRYDLNHLYGIDRKEKAVIRSKLSFF